MKSPFGIAEGFRRPNNYKGFSGKRIVDGMHMNDYRRKKYFLPKFIKLYMYQFSRASSAKTNLVKELRNNW